MINIAVLQYNGDARIAFSPSMAKKLNFNDITVTLIKPNNPELFKNIKGVKVSNKVDDLSSADIVISTFVPEDEKIINILKKDSLIIALDKAISDDTLLEKFKTKSIKFLALNKIPRITRAQTMDILSSQANIGGYRAVIEALYEYSNVCPMMMTAGGTIRPAKFLIVGAGVAGLQAIATARRMGAIVSAFDVRTAAKEQVESLGAKFIEIESDENMETKGGYAKEMSKEYKEKQAEKLKEEVSKSNLVITTAQIPNKPAPKLITDDMIKLMAPGSVIVDMAVETGGNCEGSEKGKMVVKHGVKIIGYENLPGKVHASASELFANNVFNLLKTLISDGNLKLDMEDEIIKSALIVS